MKKYKFLAVLPFAFLLGCGDAGVDAALDSLLSSASEAAELSSESSQEESSSSKVIALSSSIAESVESSDEADPESSVSAEPESSADVESSDASEPESSETVPESSSAIVQEPSEPVTESSASVEESSTSVIGTSSASYEPFEFSCDPVEKDLKKNITLFGKEISLTLLNATLDVNGFLRNDSTAYIVKISTGGTLAGTACKAARDSISKYSNPPLAALDPLTTYLSITPTKVDTTFFTGATMEVDDHCNSYVKIITVHKLGADYTAAQGREYLELQKNRCKDIKINTTKIKKQLCDDPDWKDIATDAGYCG